MENVELAIIGAGPGGLAAALYGARAGAIVLVFENALPGGRINYTDAVENYPGVPEPENGMQFAQRFYNQVQRFNVRVVQKRIDALTLNSEGLPTLDAGGQTYQAKACIIASGTRAKTLNVPGEKELMGRGISLCAVCDGALYRNKEVMVIGGGDSACEEALHLARLCSRVHIVHRRDRFRAVKALADKVADAQNITIHFNRVVKQFVGKDGRLERVILASTAGEADETVAVAGAFLYVGNTPNTDFLKVNLERNAAGYIVTDDRMRTSVERIYAVGDVRDKFLRQVVTAAADGAVAAMDAVARWC